MNLCLHARLLEVTFLNIPILAIAGADLRSAVEEIIPARGKKTGGNRNQVEVATGARWVGLAT